MTDAAIPLPPELAVDDEPFTLSLLDQFLDAFAEVGADAGPDDCLAAPVAFVGGELGPWRIADDGLAEWAMRHVAQIDEEAMALTVQAERWWEKIDEWHRAKTRTILARRRFFEAHLERYALDQREATAHLGKRQVKTVTLPSGTVSTRQKAAAAVVVDEAAAIAWARATLTFEEQQRVVKVAESVRVADLRAVVDVIVTDHGPLVLYGGEQVPGCDVAPGDTTATVKPARP